MSRREFAPFLQQHGLQPNHVYLLELLPLIEMIWADGRNQVPEREILQHFTHRHLEALQREAGGMEVVSLQDADQFIQHFMQQRPSPALLAELRELTCRVLNHGEALGGCTWERVMDYCLDIAAACAASYPHNFDQRVQAEEKALIRQLAQALQERRGLVA